MTLNAFRFNLFTMENMPMKFCCHANKMSDARK